jgi:hypothetical protein
MGVLGCIWWDFESPLKQQNKDTREDLMRTVDPMPTLLSLSASWIVSHSQYISSQFQIHRKEMFQELLPDSPKYPQCTQDLKGFSFEMKKLQTQIGGCGKQAEVDIRDLRVVLFKGYRKMYPIRLAERKLTSLTRAHTRRMAVNSAEYADYEFNDLDRHFM